ncbi:hypothetical protein C9374_008753 [Naegleria lovaniensis]|uniref:Uncharacterized protein n=1 Tax=Naegleria lovaniensis TaxID=51637 RepID=A0AA88KHF3_NAELO|nr:uncharacterized protein C9374_008753 [Naegleria lovaniensis]KAG2378131.1 hypothetical protein C9374_008753 [Naegleria lovaniensis]
MSATASSSSHRNHEGDDSVRESTHPSSSSLATTSTLPKTIPFPYLICFENTYYWRAAFNHIIGKLYISFDFLYFEGHESTMLIHGKPLANASSPVNIVKTEKNRPVSVVVLFENIHSVERENYLLNPCLCVKTNLNHGEKHYFYKLESITNCISIIEHASQMSLSCQLRNKLIALKEERPEVKSHSKPTKQKPTKKKQTSTSDEELSTRDKIEREKDEMILLAKRTKSINQDSLQLLSSQQNDLKETKEKYLEPMNTYNALGSRLLTGMSWGGFFKNLWSYSNWKKIEKQALVFQQETPEKQRSLDFDAHAFEILIRKGDEKHYTPSIAVMRSKVMEIIDDRQSRYIQESIEFSNLSGLEVRTPFILTLIFKSTNITLTILSVFTPFIIDHIKSCNKTIIPMDETGCFHSSKFDLFSLYSKNSIQLVQISTDLLRDYFPKDLEDETNKKDAKLDYLFDIVNDIHSMASVTNNVLTESGQFLEDFVTDVQGVTSDVNKNTKVIDKKLESSWF